MLGKGGFVLSTYYAFMLADRMDHNIYFTLFLFSKNSEGFLWKPKILPYGVIVELKFWIPLCKLQKQKERKMWWIWLRMKLCLFSRASFLSGQGYNPPALPCLPVESGGVWLLHVLCLQSITIRGEEFSICTGSSEWNQQPPVYYPCRRKVGFVVCNV